MTKTNKLIPPNKNIDHQRCSPNFPDDSLREKWWNVLINDPKEKAIWEEDIPYDGNDLSGSGRIKPGDTIQWQHYDILEVDDKGMWTKVKVTYTSEVHTIKKSVYEDTFKNRIPSRGPRYVIIRTPAALDVYDLLLETNKGLTITRISTITGLSRNTVYRFCKNLVLHDWLKREEDLSYTVLDVEAFPQHITLFKDE